MVADSVRTPFFALDSMRKVYRRLFDELQMQATKIKKSFSEKSEKNSETGQQGERRTEKREFFFPNSRMENRQEFFLDAPFAEAISSAILL